ncbi:stage III sporulation protein AG [Paenibacillus glycanilyticus]|uniref:Stage III sporulation protein AG n=1 Tax=Paenibacillus glycanilyticus TaxID=126569 RepID=A0ABQ6GDQ1_9BACL|nr:stage III sporulation protein AG [Paenibacillus glycanilyticus]GLX69094.1 stage III sporulation protein AG [Paenibacillus glycanilyticus]
MAKWLSGLESMVGGGPGGPKRVKTFRLLLVIGCIGAALMLLNSFLKFDKVDTVTQDANPPPQESTATWGEPAEDASPFAQFERPLENRLKEILEKIVGVSSVDVLVTIDSTEETVYATNDQVDQSITDENDRNGGKRHITAINKNGQIVIVEVAGDQKPIVTKKINPSIRGVLIVAKGAENQTVRRLIIDAVEKGVNVPANRISVAPSKQ